MLKYKLRSDDKCPFYVNVDSIERWGAEKERESGK